MKICPVRAELLHADATETKKATGAFRTAANARKPQRSRTNPLRTTKKPSAMNATATVFSPHTFQALTRMSPRYEHAWRSGVTAPFIIICGTGPMLRGQCHVQDIPTPAKQPPLVLT